jgi:hypothetical protein
MKYLIRKIAISGVCLALCMVLPFLTGQLPEIGNALCPMHLPVFLCGLLCGWQYGATVGFVAPFLRFFLFMMPPIIPKGIGMAFELAAYGTIVALLYAKLPRKPLSMYVSMLGAMLGGRIVWGIVRVLLAGVVQTAFTWQYFLVEGFVKSVPGIIAQLVLVPPIVIALQKANVVEAPAASERK